MIYGVIIGGPITLYIGVTIKISGECGGHWVLESGQDFEVIQKSWVRTIERAEFLLMQPKTEAIQNFIEGK